MCGLVNVNGQSGSSHVWRKNQGTATFPICKEGNFARFAQTLFAIEPLRLISLLTYRRQVVRKSKRSLVSCPEFCLIRGYLEQTEVIIRRWAAMKEVCVGARDSEQDSTLSSILAVQLGISQCAREDSLNG